MKISDIVNAIRGNAPAPIQSDLQTPAAKSENYIQVSIIEDYIEVQIKTFIDGKPKSWIQMDGEQVDHLISLLQISRAALKKDRR